MADSTELRGHRGEAERLPIGASSDTIQDEGDTSTCESASAGDAVKPVLCSIGGCRFGDGSSVCGDDDENMVVMLTDHQVWWLIISIRKR